MARVKDAVWSHPILASGAFMLLVVVGVGFWVWHTVFRVEASVVYFAVPEAPQLSPETDDQVVYRIDANQSEVSYRVEERLAGTTHHATGSTQGVAGDIRVDFADPSRTELGQVVVNVQQFTSDQRLRDERIRHDYLESNRYPLAMFDASEVTGLPADIEDGERYDIQLDGELTVKRSSAPVSLDATARLDRDRLEIEAGTTVRMSDYDVGPIRVAGLVSTGDEVELRFDLTAVDAEQLGDPTGLATTNPDDTPDEQATGPSFGTEVQPVLEEHCASCHAPEGIGAAVWELDTAGDAQRIASGLGLSVETAYMPPWPASDMSEPFEHDASLTAEEIDTVTAWAEAGGQLDVDAGTQIEAPDETAAHPEPDLELRAEAPYQGSIDLTNDYRCVVMDPEITEETAVTGYEFVPDQVENVHHALVYRLPAEFRDRVEERDAADPGTGYQCFGGVGAGAPELMMGWAPGRGGSLLPDGVALPLAPGDFFVTQVHYHFAHSAPADHSTLVLETDERPPDDFDRVQVTTYLAPAEIPCGPSESGPLCDRDNALAALAEEFGPPGPLIANGLHAGCGTTVDELAVLDGTVASSSCDHHVRREGKILSVLGHMHEIGSTFRMTLNPDTPEERVLLDIPRWDFNWQFNYIPVDDIVIDRDDVIRIECSWDRDFISPAAEPRWVTWAEGTEDEMCYSAVTTREQG